MKDNFLARRKYVYDVVEEILSDYDTIQKSYGNKQRLTSLVSNLNGQVQG